MTHLIRKSTGKIPRSFILLLFAFMGSASLAQSARISGEVTDQQGKLIPGALISVRNQATGIHRETKSTEAGAYDVSAIDPGNYTVRVMKPGFRTVERRGLELFVDTNTRVDFQLKVGSESATITVEADASLLQPNDPAAVTEITGRQLDDEPLLQQGRDRSPAAFIFLAPGVQGNYTLAGAENTAATNQFTVNGSQMQVTEFFLEGAEVGQMRTVGSFNESAPAVDAVREFKVTTTLLPSEYGHSGPAAGSFSIKSGTNRFRGSVYEYIRNDYLDAKPWGAVIRTYTRLNEFGATLGGPVLLPHYNGHDRTFFFFSYGGGRKSAADSIQDLRVPTQAQISGVFDTTKYFMVYDPSTLATCSARSTTGTCRYQFGFGPGTTPGPAGNPVPTGAAINTIPAGDIDPVAKAIAAYFPAPNLNTTSTKDYQGIIGERLLNPDHYTAKIDHQLSSSQHVSATYVGTSIPRNKVGTGLPPPLNSSSYQTVKGTTARLNDDWVLGATRVNALILGFNRFGNVETVPAGNAFPIPGVPGGKLPIIVFTQSYPSFASDGNFNDVENNYQIRDVFRWQLRAHSLSFGGEIRNVQFNDITPQVPQTTISISDLESNAATSPATARSGDAFASFLLGQVDSATVVYPYEIATRFKYGGLFIQDDWKILPKLTLNLGLRWDVQSFPTEAHNHSSILDLSTPNPGTVGPGGVLLPGALIFAGSGPGGSGRSSFGSTPYNSVGPRFGFAYQPAANIVVRGGYGLFYSNPNNSISSVGFQSQGNIQSPDNGLHPAFILSSGVPAIPGLQPSLSSTLLNPTNGSTFQNASYIDRNAGVLPRIQQWSIGVQQAFGHNLLLDMSYVGSRGDRLVHPEGVSINQLDPKYLSLGALLTTPAASVAGQSVKLADGELVQLRLPYQGFLGSVFQSLRPYPQFNTLTSLAAKLGYNNYDSLQVVLNKRFSHGLTLGANYVWSKNLGNSSPGTYGGGVVDNALQNTYDPNAEYSILPIDVAQAFVAHYTYEFPFRSGHPLFTTQKFWQHTVNVFADGWKLSGVQRYQSGYPFPILMTNSLGVGNRVLRPNVVPGVDPATHKSVHGFNPLTDSLINAAAFSTPAAYSFGNARPTYGTVRNFPILNEDFSLTKQTNLSEHLEWNLYLQTFNAFNRHRFTAFDTNFSDTTFGQASVPSQPRYVQIGTRFIF